MSQKDIIEEILSNIRQVVDSNEQLLDDKAMFVVQKITDKIFSAKRKERMIREGKTYGEYMPYDFAAYAYQYILEHGGSHNDALDAAQEVYQKSDEWLKQTRNKPFFHASDLVKAFDNHPEQIIMDNNGTLDRQALSAANTPVKQLKKLSRYKGVSDLLESLKDRVDTHQSEIERLSIKTDLTDAETERLLELTGIDYMTKEDQCHHLDSKGYSQKQIAKYLQVDVRTVRRWMKNI